MTPDGNPWTRLGGVFSGWDLNRTADLLIKGCVVLGSLGFAAHALARKPPDVEAAKMYLIAAAAAFGISIKVDTAARKTDSAKAAAAVNSAKLDVVAADIENVRNNPAMPGTALTFAEQLERLEKLSGSGLTKAPETTE